MIQHHEKILQVIRLRQKTSTFTLHRTCPPTRRRFMGLAVASTASALRHAFVASWRHWRAIHAASKCSTSWAPAVRIWWSKDSVKGTFQKQTHRFFGLRLLYMGGFAKNLSMLDFFAIKMVGLKNSTFYLEGSSLSLWTCRVTNIRNPPPATTFADCNESHFKRLTKKTRPKQFTWC